MGSIWHEAENVREEFGTVEIDMKNVRFSLNLNIYLNLSHFKEEEKP